MELLVKVPDPQPDCLRYGVSVAPLGPFPRHCVGGIEMEWKHMPSETSGFRSLSHGTPPLSCRAVVHSNKDLHRRGRSPRRRVRVRCLRQFPEADGCTTKQEDRWHRSMIDALEYKDWGAGTTGCCDSPIPK